ncbi:MAG: hypothetical protein ACRETB_07410 [Steroidobacteraceae bacterium]
MTIGSTSQLSTLLAQMLNANRQAGTVPGAGSSTVSPSTGSTHQGGLTSAVLQALQQIGVSGAAPSSTASTSSSTATGTSSTQTSGSLALQSFMQSLLAALQPQGGSASFPVGANGHGHSHGGRHGGGHSGSGRIEQGLQSLIQELQSPSATSATGTSSTSGTSGVPSTSSSSSALASLQQSFNQLLSTLGSGSGNSASLGSFLNTLSTDLASKPATGNLVSVQA